MAKDMNPPEGGPSPGQTARAGSWRAFRPLIIWLVLAMPILGWDIHRRNAARTFLRADVKLEGGALEAPLQIEVSGKPFSLREPVPVGNQVIKIWSQDTEVWETNKFIWYGENPLGTVQLKRSRGELRVAVKPAPVQVSITGRLTNATSQTASPVFQGLPVGNYRVRLRFQHFTREVTATVTRSTTSTLDESFPAGNLQIGSEPPGARYELRNVRGDAPALISDLPPGEHHLVLTRGDYTKTQTLTVSRSQTAEARIVFEYGKVSVTSEATNAVVSLDDKTSGNTPMVLGNLMPGRYKIEAAREGFQAARWAVEVSRAALRLQAGRVEKLRLSGESDHEAFRRKVERAVEAVGLATSPVSKDAGRIPNSARPCKGRYFFFPKRPPQKDCPSRAFCWTLSWPRTFCQSRKILCHWFSKPRRELSASSPM